MSKYMIAGYLVLGIILASVIGFVGLRLLSAFSVPEGLNFAPSKDDQVHVDIVPPGLPEDMTIANKSGIKLKILAYNANDDSLLIPQKQWTLDPGGVAQLSRANYKFKVFKPEFFDKLLATSGVIGSDVTVSGGEGNIVISGSPGSRNPVSFTNKTKENLKVDVYNSTDTVQLAPLKSFSLGPERTVEWTDDPPTPPRFSLKVFRPQFLDKQLAAENNIRDQSKITISPGKK